MGWFFMMYLIGLFSVDGRIVPRLLCLTDYNGAVDKLNRLLRDGELVDYFLPEEKPELAKQLGL